MNSPRNSFGLRLTVWKPSCKAARWVLAGFWAPELLEPSEFTVTLSSPRSVSRHWPSLQNIRRVRVLYPSSVCRYVPVAASQSRMVVSSEADASVLPLPSGETATTLNIHQNFHSCNHFCINFPSTAPNSAMTELLSTAFSVPNPQRPFPPSPFISSKKSSNLSAG